MIENRSSTRHPVNLPVTIKSGNESSSQTMINMSLGGALVTMPEKVAIGTELELSFAIAEPAIEITVKGVVRWSGPDSTGVQFDGMRAKEVWSLTEYFKQFES